MSILLIHSNNARNIRMEVIFGTGVAWFKIRRIFFSVAQFGIGDLLSIMHIVLLKDIKFSKQNHYNLFSLILRY